MSRTNPFSLIHDALWKLVTDSEFLSDKIKQGNRILYGSREGGEKDILATADCPELRLVPAGGDAMIARSSSSTSTVRRYAWQMRVGDQNVHEFYDLEWHLLSALATWPTVVKSLLWEGQEFVKRVGTIEITQDMLRPRREIHEDEIKGWGTIWLCEIECWFRTELLRSNT